MMKNLHSLTEYIRQMRRSSSVKLKQHSTCYHFIVEHGYSFFIIGKVEQNTTPVHFVVSPGSGDRLNRKTIRANISF